MVRPRYSLFQRRSRVAARVALYASLVLGGGALLLSYNWLERISQSSVDQPWARIDYSKFPEVQLLQQYLRINTSPSGSELEGARFLARQFEQAGIPATVFDMGNGMGNTIAILEGERPEALVLHNHIDTDPVPDPGSWAHPPFGGEIDGPRLFGRGVFDMKSIAIAQMYAMLELKRSGTPLRRSIIFLATSSEERGSELGVLWFLRHHPDLVTRFWAVLTEGGVVEGRSLEDFKYWGTEFAQKRFIDLLVCAVERAPLEELRNYLIDDHWRSRHRNLTPELKVFLTHYAPSRDYDRYRELLITPESLLHDLAAFAELPDYLRAQYRAELHPFGIRAAPGGGYELPMKLHLQHGAALEPALNELLPAWLSHGLDVQVAEELSADGSSPLDHPAFQAIQEVLAARFPDTPSGPYLLPRAATDARFFRRHGIPAYGFSPFPILTTDTLQIGQSDERMMLPGYQAGVEIYGDVIQRLVGSPGRLPGRSPSG